MQIALTLLISAQTLLAMVMGNQSLPQEFKDNALTIATNAIKVAQEELAKPVAPVIVTEPIVQTTQTIQTQPTTVVQPVQQSTTPSYGSIISSMKIKLLVNCVNSTNLDSIGGTECNLRAFYVDNNGQPTRNTGNTLTFTSNGKGEFVNYISPYFISTSTNQLVMNVKNLGGEQKGQEVIYIQPDKTKPTFNVSDDKGSEVIIEIN